MADKRTLRGELREVLTRYGYQGDIPPVGDKKSEKLLKSLLKELKSCDDLTGEPKERFDELRRLSKELSEDDFQKVLETKQAELSKNFKINELKSMELKEEVQSLKEQLDTLRHVHKQLTAQKEKCVEEKDHMTDHVTKLRQEYQESLHESEESNLKVNKSLEDLETTISNLCDYYSNQINPQDKREKSRGETTPSGRLMSSVSLTSYHEAEDRFIKCLSDYAKKQLTPNVHKESPNDDEYGILNEEQLTRHLSEEEYQRQSEQLKRLRTILPQAKMECIANEASKEYYTAACEKLKAEMEEIKSGQGVVAMDIETLKEQIEHKERHLSELKQEIQSYDTSLPQLLHDWASLKTSCIVHGNYDAKLERQKLNLARKEEIITQLKKQRGRQELVSLLMEAEHRYHRDTHQLLEATHSQLEKWKIETTERQSRLNDITSRDTTSSKENERITNCLAQLLDISPSPNESHVTQEAVEKGLNEFIKEREETETKQVLLDEKLTNQIQEMKDVLSELEECVFGKEKENRIVRFTSEEYTVSVDKLKTMLSSLEVEIKSILKDYSEKRKALQSSPLLEQERNLFVYFFTDTQKLSSVMADLTYRVNTLSTAVGLTTQPQPIATEEKQE